MHKRQARLTLHEDNEDTGGPVATMLVGTGDTTLEKSYFTIELERTVVGLRFDELDQLVQLLQKVVEWRAIYVMYNTGTTVLEVTRLDDDPPKN